MRSWSGLAVICSCSMPEQKLFERDFLNRLAPPLLEPQRPGAEAADRTRPHFKDEYAPVVHAALGMNRPVPQADRNSGARDGVDDVFLHRRGRRRRRDVEGFLEERPIE